jgi:hypothetical protein
VLNPWTGSIHMWPGSNPGGPRAPPPRAGFPPHQQQALMAAMVPVPPPYSTPGSGLYS